VLDRNRALYYAYPCVNSPSEIAGFNPRAADPAPHGAAGAILAGLFPPLTLQEDIMEAMESILSRRSIRKYTGDAVPEDVVEQVLKAAMSAPSAGNQQPWHFVVMRERAILDRIPGVHPHSLMIREAPVAVLVCADPTLETHKGYWVQDCAAATENMLIAVQALGYGAVWLGVYPREERVTGIRALLGIPEHVIPFALVPIGRPAEQKPASQRYTREKVHVGRWQ